MKGVMKIAVISVLIMLTACSTRLAYNNLDWLVLWYLDDYIELDTQQENLFDDQLNQILIWHRQQGLSGYRIQLLSFKRHILAGELTAEQWQKHLTQLRQHWLDLRFKFSESLVLSAVNLSPDQVHELFINLSKKSKEDRQNVLELDSSERQAEKRNQINDSMKDQLGHVTQAQDDMLDEFLSKQVDTKLMYLDYTQQVQKEAKDVFSGFHQLKNETAFKQDLLAILQRPNVYRSAQLQQGMDQNRIELIRFLTDLSKSIDAQQKQHLLERVDNWLSIIDDLQEALNEQ